MLVIKKHNLMFKVKNHILFISSQLLTIGVVSWPSAHICFTNYV